MLNRILVIFLVCIMFGCQSAEKKELNAINEAEHALYADQDNFKFDEQLARNTIKAYETYADHNPKSEKTPEILFKSADLHRALKEYQPALDIYEKIENQYPDYEKLPHCIFLEGFVYENELYRLEKAKERYETFLQKYPDHELADDVKFSLHNLGKSPEEIIKQFEKTVATDSAGTTVAADSLSGS